MAPRFSKRQWFIIKWIYPPIGWGVVTVAVILLIPAFRSGGFTRKRSLLYMTPAAFLVGFCAGWFMPLLILPADPGAVVFLQGFEK